MRSAPSCKRSSGKMEPTEVERNRVLGVNRLLVPPRYRRRVPRRCKRLWRIAIMFFAATEDSPSTRRRFGPLLGSRFVAWTSISMTTFMNPEPFRITYGPARSALFGTLKPHSLCSVAECARSGNRPQTGFGGGPPDPPVISSKKTSGPECVSVCPRPGWNTNAVGLAKQSGRMRMRVLCPVSPAGGIPP